MTLKTFLLSAFAVIILTTSAIAQNVPSINSPPTVPIPGNVVTQGQTWTIAQWIIAFAQKKDILVFKRTTSAAAAVTLTTDGNAPTTTNTGVIPSGTEIEYSAQCLIFDKTATKVNTYTFGASLIQNIAGTVGVSGNPAAVAGPNISGMTLVAVPAIGADNTNKGWAITYTPPTSNTDTIDATCTLELLVVQ